tara:strand:- start:905 stop:1468 length:564 start_codon:yes stop_codon:yes gene_type:complete
MDDKVRFTEIAERLGINRSTVQRVVSRVSDELGISPIKGKQNVLYLSREEAEIFISYYESQSSRNGAETEASPNRFGFFYIIQLVPEALPNRVKIGYTDNLNHRLSEHRTAAPTAKLLKSWPCKRSWDYAAMDSITKEGCNLVLNEVYEGEVQGFIDRADKFFELMPDDSAEKNLSEHSPLKNENDT